jgi:aminoglycoside 3-N-acetyltransferase
MQKQILFRNGSELISNIDILNTLKVLEVDQTDVLYVHTALNFGVPNREIKKQVLLELLFEILLKLDISTLIFPTYTFSFCNGDPFSVQDSKTPMGLLNEYIRNQPGVLRSRDPLMSNALVGTHREFVENIGKFSVGDNSTFDLLHKTNLKVKFLFFGPKIGDCFTHMHYIENEQNVPYRYNRSFSGLIKDGETEYTDTYELFVRYSNVFPNEGSYIYGNILTERGICKKAKIGASAVSVLEEKPAYETYVELLKLSPNFYIKEIFEVDENTTMFSAKNMVAL